MVILKSIITLFKSVSSIEAINSIKQSGNSSNLSHFLLDLMSKNEIESALRFELLNEIFSLSKEVEWVDHVQEALIDVIWLLGKSSF